METIRINCFTNSYHYRHCLICSGYAFTLIELIVVMALISIFFFFSIPKFNESMLTDHEKKVSRWIMIKVRVLKEKAVTERKRYTLHADIDQNRFWISDETMSEDALIQAEKEGFDLEDDIRLSAVEYPESESISIGQATIHFYKQGYSDMAIIRLIDNEMPISFKIEPFLSGVIKE